MLHLKNPAVFVGGPSDTSKRKSCYRLLTWEISGGKVGEFFFVLEDLVTNLNRSSQSNKSTYGLFMKVTNQFGLPITSTYTLGPTSLSVWFYSFGCILAVIYFKCIFKRCLEAFLVSKEVLDIK